MCSFVIVELNIKNGWNCKTIDKSTQGMEHDKLTRSWTKSFCYLDFRSRTTTYQHHSEKWFTAFDGVPLAFDDHKRQ